MIKKIDIQKFGVFDKYAWKSVIGPNEGFRKLNIIYGRNYVGKTTLSRIIRCLENKSLHSQYEDADFSLTFYDETIVTQSNIQEFNTNTIRVYNTDFVKENLSWLHNDDGSIVPFTILGAKNVEIEKQINDINDELGKIEENKGLYFELQNKNNEYQNTKRQYDANKTDIDNKLRTKAVEIKNDSTYGFPTYQITYIKKEIESKPSILPSEKVFEYKKLLKEESKPNVELLLESKPNFDSYLITTKELLEKEIRPTQPLTDLINDSLLQEWVRQGIDRNKSRDKCGFCGSTLPSDIWQKLDDHFSKESEELRVNIKKQIETLEIAKQELAKYISLTKDSFYVTLHEKYDSLKKSWETLSLLYSNNIDILIENLDQRNKDIFTKVQLPIINDNSEDILKLLGEFNKIINENNSRTESLSTDQDDAKKLLRYSEVARYISDIDYSEKIGDIELLEEVVKELETQKNNLSEKVNTLTEEKRKLEAQAKDESKGAELVNQYLTHFFGHQELKLVAEGESPNIKFKIIRNDVKATNLSEGESSLISFCYFIAKLEDELKVEASNNLIIYIDDPISSLDNNHIFFIFSLIEAIIAKPKKYLQLFISTHNLDFLKYLRKLTEPDKYKFTPSGKNIPGLANFILERKNRTIAQLAMSPEYLRNYITEFNYLFNQIYQCSISDKETISHDFEYNFGNNMRKFLEAFLFYKYPSHKLNLNQRLTKFFADDTISISLINRVINEYSHLGDNFERGLEPIDSEAIHLVSKAVMERINTIDPDQYQALIESVTPIVENQIE
ncbi:AAA family ATPase [Flavobacterium hauense]